MTKSCLISSSERDLIAKPCSIFTRQEHHLLSATNYWLIHGAFGAAIAASQPVPSLLVSVITSCRSRLLPTLTLPRAANSFRLKHARTLAAEATCLSAVLVLSLALSAQQRVTRSSQVCMFAPSQPASERAHQGLATLFESQQRQERGNQKQRTPGRRASY